MTSTPEQVIEKIREALEGDHERLCQGREYTCTCGHDDAVQQALTAALQSAADTPAPPPPPPPQTHVVGPDTTTIAAHMQDFEAFVAQAAPKLHWKVYRDLGADPSRSNGYYDGWQHGFGEALFGPLPLPELMAEMKASVIAKVAATATEDGR